MEDLRKVPEELDWEAYKELFGKSYKNLEEEFEMVSSTRM